MSSDDIMPGVVPTEEENRRWNALPVDERRQRLEQALCAGFVSEFEGHWVAAKIYLSRQALADLAEIAEKRPGFDRAKIYADMQAVVASPDYGMPMERESLSCQRYRSDPRDGFDIYYQQQGESIVVGRVLHMYRVRDRRPRHLRKIVNPHLYT